MKVAVDVTPLDLTRAGTARYLHSLLPRVEREVAVERLRSYSKGKTGTLWLDLAWYPHVLPHRARSADVLHCPTYRGPVRSRVPLVVTVHDLAVFRHPEAFPPWTHTYSRVVVPRGEGVRGEGEVGDDALARLYRGALCVAYPSLYEGFGIPVLEAMACGAPVVTSRGGATEEVAGGAAVLVDPEDVASIAAGIEDAIARRTELRAAGLQRAAAYSWDESARLLLQAYEAAA